MKKFDLKLKEIWWISEKFWQKNEKMLRISEKKFHNLWRKFKENKCWKKSEHILMKLWRMFEDILEKLEKICETWRKFKKFVNNFSISFWKKWKKVFKNI